jgi:hypothetical protein
MLIIEPTDKKEDLNSEALKKLLEDAGIDFSEWGKGEAKAIEHLRSEINEGESILEKGESGELVRRVSIVGADIYYVSPGGERLHLKEDRQIFKDGRERKRDYGHAVSEKMKQGEDPRVAIIRGIREELGIDGLIDPQKAWEDEKIILSPSYPGLVSHYIRYGFDVILSENQFKPEGYIEEQDKMSTYFIWEEVKER